MCLNVIPARVVTSLKLILLVCVIELKANGISPGIKIAANPIVLNDNTASPRELMGWIVREPSLLVAWRFPGDRRLQPFDRQQDKPGRAGNEYEVDWA